MKKKAYNIILSIKELDISGGVSEWYIIIIIFMTYEYYEQ